MVCIDLEKAYDRVPRQEVWRCMREKGVPGKYVMIVSGTAEAGTETNKLVWLLTSFNHQVPKTTMSQPADTVRLTMPCLLTAHTVSTIDQRRYCAQLAPKASQTRALQLLVQIKRSTDRESRWMARVHGSVI